MKRKKILLSLLIVLFLGSCYFFYKRKLSPTKIAVINYPDFMFTKMQKSNDSRWIKIESFTPDSLPDLSSYDQLLIFGMGIELPASEEQKIEQAGKNGSSIFIQALTSPRLEHLANMHGKPFDYISEYMNNGGKENYKNMFNYIRRVIDKKTSFTDPVIPAKIIPSDVIFYKDEDALFEKTSDFESYAQKKNIHKENNPKVIIFTSVPGPFNANREHLNSLITEMEQRNFNVYPIAAFGNRMQYMKEIHPDLIIYLPHGRMSRGKQMVQWLKEQNLPVLCPVSVFQKHDKWLKDKQGLVGGLLSQSVAMPELDGGIVPYAVFAQYEDPKGYLLFQAIPERLKKFGQIAQNYINLRKKKNQNKKIAIVYFKGPGKNAMVASNMEVLPSLYNLLLRLKKEGYDLGNLPENYETFEKDLYRQGPVLGAYASGSFEKFLKTGSPELIPVEDYNAWSQALLPEDLIKDVVDKYGKAPGNYMNVTKNSKDYLAVARLQYGNVVLLPQPLPAEGENEFQLIHGAKVAPPHPYIAPYLWLQKGFNADAVIHFGTHGSLEFLPGKQIALSDYDWTDPLIGTTPHYYVYTISNVGEGMIAKRRSYAVTQTYLTPPFIEAHALSKQEQLHQKIHKYEQLQGAVKQAYALSIKKMVVAQKLHKDLDLDDDISRAYTEEEMMKLSNYLEEVEHEKITGGLYTMGVPYSPKKIDETVLMMYVNSLSYNLAEIDIQKDLFPRKKMENKSFFNNRYTNLTEKKIKAIIQGASPDVVFNQLVAQKDIERAQKWEEKQAEKMQVNKKMFTPRNSKTKQDQQVNQAEKDQLRALIIKIMPDEEKVRFVKKMESDKEYERIISLLDPQKRARAQKVAKIIPSMGKALKISEDPDVYEIIKLVEKPSLRFLALDYTNDKNLKTEVEKERIRQDSLLLKNILDEKNYSLIAKSKSSLEQITYKQVGEYQELIDYFSEKKERLLHILNSPKTDQEKSMLDFLKNDFESCKKKMTHRINELETREMLFAQAVFEVQKNLNSILLKKEALQQSPELEFVSLINSLNGGYTPPSSGGDPVSNPSTVPTGRNLYSIDAEKTPSKEAWNVSKKLAQSLLDDYKSKHDGKYPQKISFTLWSSSFIETEGTTIGQILYFLGVEPVWNNFGRVNDIRLIPLKELKRPRIDVIVQTSGQLRDLAASRLFLINKAIAMVSAADEEEGQNFVSKGIADAEADLVKKGFSPKKAKELSKKRVFGGVGGNYGTGIMGMVESSERWDSTQTVAQQYIKNMGAVYGDQDDWGAFDPGVFEAALLNTEAVVQPRQSNTWGALSLDHVYEFMGGLNLAVKEVTGNDPESYFNDFRNSSNPRVQGLKEAIWVETRTTLMNPLYIKELTKGGASSAETFAETFRNTFGWNVMKPSVIENRLWDNLYNVYVKDDLNLNLHAFFKKENPYALQEMTAVMLETVRKKMWKATPEQIETIAKLHAELVKEHEAGCSGFVCDNFKLKKFIEQQLPDNLKKSYQEEIGKVRESGKDNSKQSVVLKKDKQDEKIESSNQLPVFLKNKTILFALAGVIALMLLVVILLKKKRK